MSRFRRRARILASGKSPSTECMKRTYNRAILNGGTTVDFSANVENIRSINRTLSYTDGNVFFKDAPFVYVPSSYGESKNFAQVQNKRNLLINSDTGTTQSVTVTAQTYTLALEGTGTYTLSGVFSGSLVGNGASRATLVFTPTAGTLTLTLSGSITKVQLEVGKYATPYQKTVAAGDGIVDFNFTRATSATVTNKQGVIEDSCYNRLVNSATGTTQSITVTAGTYNLSFFGTGSYTLSGVGSGTLSGTGATTRVNQSFTCTAGTLTLTVSGSITNVQFSLGGLRDYIKTTNRLNVPRLDYSRGLGKPELLIEPQATNIALQSGDFSNATWLKLRSTIIQVALTNPLNLPFVSILKEDTSNNTHYISIPDHTFTIANWTSSIYAKAKERTQISINLYDGTTSHWAIFDLTNGNVLSSSGLITYSSVNAGGGWYRLSVTALMTNASISNTAYILSNGNTWTYNGDGASGVYICGAQLEAGAYATTYIPTTTATVTRNAETSYTDLWNNAILNKTNFTLYWEGYLYDGQSTGMSLCLSDTSTAVSNTNQIGWYNLNTPFYNIGNTRTNGSSNATNNTYNKFAIQYNNGTVNFYRNGVNIWASQTVAVFDYRYLIMNSAGTTYTTDKIALFNRTLTNAECQTITT